jgi:hypothetical protein
MISFVKDLSCSPDLPGGSLISPLQSYHRFFTKETKNLHRRAWRVAHVASGILCYPILGALAGVGFIIKLIGMTALTLHNRAEIERYRNKQFGLDNRCDQIMFEGRDIGKRGHEMRTIRQFVLTPQTAATNFERIQREIQRCTTKCRKVYGASCTITQDNQKVTYIQLRLLDPIN